MGTTATETMYLWGDTSQQVVTIPAALAAAGTSYQFGRAETWKIESVCFTLVTAGGGGARQVVVKLTDTTGSDVYGVAAPATQAGGLTVVYSFAPLIPGGGSGALGFIQGPFFGGRLPENLTLQITVSGTAAADAITVARMIVSQDPTRPPDDYAV